MGVLIECINVVIRNATVEERLSGGMHEYERDCPNGTFCTDGEVCRVGFMTATDAASYVEDLASRGFARPTPAGSPEVALLNDINGFDFPCDWLELGRVELGGGRSAAVARVRGTALSSLVAPANWKPGKVRKLSTTELSGLEFLGTKEGLDIFRDKATGAIRYVGRTREGAPPADISKSMIRERFQSLADELARLGALEGGPPGDYRGDLVSLHQRAKELVDDIGANEPGPLHLQGIAARLLGQWDEAASLFHRVTEMRPDYLAGWLELTWTLASLRRFEEAERAARKAVALDAESASALGNLAAVLLEEGKVDEARAVANRALLADPADAKNKAVLAAVDRAASRKQSWWRSLLRTKHNDPDSVC